MTKVESQSTTEVTVEETKVFIRLKSKTGEDGGNYFVVQKQFHREFTCQLKE